VHGAAGRTRRGHVGPKVQRLRGGEHLDRQHVPHVADHLAQLAHRGPAHRDVVLLVAGGRDGVDAAGVREHLVLADQRRRRVLRDHEPGVRARVARQEGRQAAGERRVEHPVGAPLGDAGELRHRHREHVAGERQRLAVEVAGGHDLPVRHDHRVVDHRAELDVDDPPGVRENVADRAVHLGSAAQAVRVLDGVVALAVARDQRAARQQPAEVGGAGQLAGVRADHLHPLVVRLVGPEQRLDAHRGGDVGHRDEQPDVVDGQREQHLHRLGAVDERQALLRREDQRLDAGLGQQLGRGPAPQVGVTAPAQPALADQRLRQVRELGEVAGRTDGALAGDHLQQVVLE
jgi:hypothetical protein